jgi:hypothetical protein
VSFLAHQAAYRTTRWAAWRLKNRKAIAADKQWHKDNDAAMSEAMARVFGPQTNNNKTGEQR